MILSLVTLVLAAGPCAPVERRAADARRSQLYAKVARGEAGRGATEASVVAWRLAAQLEPNEDGEAGQALRRLCSFEQAEALFAAGDCRSARPLLTAARGGPDDAPAALLDGICAFEQGDDAAALGALTVASADPLLADTAGLFLGLLALRRGDSRTALARLDAASGAQSPALRSTAAQLLRLAGRKERLIIDAAAEAGYDSNASLVAFPTVLPGGADDGYAAVTAGLTLRPLGDEGPYLLMGGGYRKYGRFGPSDVGLATGTLGWELEVWRLRASVDYGLDFVALGGAPWLLRQRGTARAVLPLGALLLSAEYLLRHDALLAQSALAETGFRHAGRLALSLRAGPQTLEVAGVITRMLATTAERTSTEGGAELSWQVRALPRLTVEAGVSVRARVFDAMDPELLATRRDVQLEAQLGADFELTAALRLFAVFEGRRLWSSVPALTHTRLAASAGLRLSLGVW